MSYLPEPHTYSKCKIKVEFDLSSYPFKIWKNAGLARLKSGIDILDGDKLKDIPISRRNLKSKVDNLDVDKLAPVPLDFSKLSDVIDQKLKRLNMMN